MKKEVVNVNDLTVSYDADAGHVLGKKKKVPVLRDISFSMEKGEILGLVGESGSGKSTLAKAMLHLIGDYSGTVTHFTDHPQMIFQDPYASLNPAKKIGWILEEPLKLKGGYTKAERTEKVLAMLRKVGLPEHFAGRLPRELSGGQRQRVCIAGALMLEPELLIADEPVSALDVTIQKQILSLLREIHSETGISILFISHDLRVVYQMCDKVMIMKSGNIVEEGPVKEVYTSPRHEYTKSLLAAAGIH